MTVNAIYSTTPSADWPSVAHILSQKHNVEPIYWINYDLKDEIQDKFPDAIVHDSIDAIQGRVPDEYTETSYSVLDSDVLSEYLEYESVVLKMMDRMDSGNATGANFTYPDRIKHYHKQLSYWHHLVSDLDPEVVVFGATPHLVYDYILYAVCQSHDVETVIFTHTSLPERFLVRGKVQENPIGLETTSSIESDLPTDLETHLQNLRGDYNTAEPNYMKSDNVAEANLVSEFYSACKAAVKSVRKLPRLVAPIEKSYIKKSRRSIENSRYKVWEWKLHQFKVAYYRYRLRKAYDGYSVEPDYSLDFIYYPLHYQPERTTSPEGGQYAHQYLALKALASTIPDNITIYVKEHPSQLSTRLSGEQGRKPRYYEDLNEVANVNLISVGSNSFDLIDNSIAVATVTGTAGWEAIVRGTPSIVFGNAWYQSSPGCYDVKTEADLDRAFDQIEQNRAVAEEAVEDFVSEVATVGYEGSLNDSAVNNVNSLYTAFCENCSIISAEGQVHRSALN